MANAESKANIVNSLNRIRAAGVTTSQNNELENIFNNLVDMSKVDQEPVGQGRLAQAIYNNMVKLESYSAVGDNPRLMDLVNAIKSALETIHGSQRTCPRCGGGVTVVDGYAVCETCGHELTD